MTTHQLATLFDSLRNGLGDGLKPATVKLFTDASQTLREEPERSLKELLSSKPTKGQTSSSKGKAPSITAEQLVEKIDQVRNGILNSTELDSCLNGANNKLLREVLQHYKVAPTNNTTGNKSKVEQLLCTTTQPKHETNGHHPVYDANDVKRGVELYLELRDVRGPGIEEVRARFEPVRHFSKATLEELSRRLEYTPDGGRDELFQRLMDQLEENKINQYRRDAIVGGV